MGGKLLKRLNLMIASTVGTTLEWYDFFVFATCAVLVFDKKFFPVDDPFVATLLSLGTFSVGFLARPLGGVVFGIAGDRFGRKNMLVISLLMMGVGTFLIGLLPTYETIGIMAPILLIVLRILQGIAVGGEASGAILIIAESMPANRRGFWTSFTMFAGPLANVLTALVIAAIQGIYGNEAFVEWAWRIPFFISVLLIAVGFWTRRRVEESPAFIEISRRQEKVEHAPLAEAFRNNLPEMFRAFFVKASENTYLYLFSTFVLLLATTHLGFPRQAVLKSLLWASALEIVVVLVAAYVSDLIGRRPVLFVGFAASVLTSYGLFTLSPGASQAHLQIAITLCLASHGIILGAMAAFMAELFPTRVRYTALSSSYQLASVAGGSIAPLVGTILLHETGTPVSVAIYAMLVSIPALISVGLAKETVGAGIIGEDSAPEAEGDATPLPSRAG